MQVDRRVWTMARWTFAAIIAASALVYILGHLSQATATIAG
jgi:hypothetical protein